MTETTNRGPEYQEVQKPAIELLCGHLGYEYALGSDLAGERASESEVLLTRRLSKKLLEINAGITEVGVKQAVTTLQLPLAMGLLEANEKLHCILSRWVTVDEIVRGQPVGRSVRYIDYENPQNNEFLVVEELTVKGSRYPRRLDLTVFVNGIPVVVIECKDSAAAHGIEKATQDLLLYQEIERGVARLFHTVQLCIGLRKRDARYGTILTPPDRYAGWSSAYPLSESDLQTLIGRKPTAQDVLLAGMLAKPNLLDLIRVLSRSTGKAERLSRRWRVISNSRR